MIENFSTCAVHSGYEPESLTGAVNPPIYATSTYKQDGYGQLRSGYEYSRTANPTRTALEWSLSELEGAKHKANAFSSGMAASDTILRACLTPGDHIIIPDDMYGGSFRLITKVFSKWGVDYSIVPQQDLSALENAFRKNTKLIWLETPTNPLLKIYDIESTAKIAHEHQALLVVDNTFATPYLQSPLELGADAVIHSATKYLGGHSDVLGGIAVCQSEELNEKLSFLQNASGAVIGPFDAFLILRGIRTLAVRMEAHCNNAEAVVEFLTNHPRIKRVIYPGLSSHDSFTVAKKQMRRFGGMVSFELHGGMDEAKKVCASTKLIHLAESLGGVESLIEHPASMTHASTSGSTLQISESLIRISVGIEHEADIIADLERALIA